MPTDPDNANLAAALGYTGRGWAVFPLHSIRDGRCTCGNPDCDSPGKHPLTAHGLTDATTDPDQIRRWWRRWAWANVGVRTGRRSGLLVLDIDPAKGGDESFEDLVHEYGVPPTTSEVLTGGGGRHHYFAYPHGVNVRNSAGKLGRGLDIRATGGYVVAPPSIHASGQRYEWEWSSHPDDVPLADAPEWFIRLLLSEPTRRAQPDAGGNGRIPEGQRNDHLASLAGTMRRRAMTAAGIEAALLRENQERCDPPLDDSEVKRIAQSIERYEPAEPNPPQAPTIPPYEPFPVAVLPGPVAGFVTAAADAIGCDAAFVALPCLTICGAAIGNSRAIRLKRGAWSEASIIWTATVADSGTKKSPAHHHAMRPIESLERQAREAHKQAMAEYNNALAGCGKGDPRPTPPVCERYATSDVTVEALVSLLSDTPRGLLVARDELSGLIGGFDQYKSRRTRADAPHYLSMWQARPVRIDRKTGRPSQRSIYVEHAAVSITGTVQPTIMAQVFGDEHFADGLAARFLLAMPPRRAVKWSDRDIAPDVADAWGSLVEGLYGLEFAYDQDTGRPYPRPLPLSPDGKAEWVAFYNGWADRQAAATGDQAAMLAKLEAYASRLALVVHCVRQVANDPTLQNTDAINGDSVRVGVALVEWFAREGERVYAALATTAEDRERGQLMDLIRRLGGRVTVREIMHAGRRFKTADQTEAALDELLAAGLATWDHPTPGDKGGRPSRVFVLAESATPVYKTPAHDPGSGGFGYVDSISANEKPPSDDLDDRPPPPTDADVPEEDAELAYPW